MFTTHMKRYVFAAALGMTAASSAWMASPALAGVRNFTILNATDQVITAAAVSSPQLDEWFLLSGPQIGPNEKERVHVGPHDLEGYCQVQLKIQFADGSTHMWSDGFNMCDVNDVKIEYDSNNQQYSVYSW